jgi:signal transduction histidine kinase
LHSLLVLPVLLGGEAVGVVALANRSEGYDDNLTAALAPFVASCSNLIAAGRAAAQRREAEAALRREADLTSLLARAGRQFLGLLDRDEILQYLSETTHAATSADVSLTLVWPSGTALTTPSVLSGFRDGEVERAQRCRVPKVLVASLLGRAGDPEVAELDGLTPETLTALGFPPISATRLIGIPLRRDGDLFGIHLATWRGSANALTASQRGVTDGIAQLANVALTNAQLLADLQQANQVKTEFVSTMSHELRTPLNVILGYVEMARDATDDAERRPPLDRIEQSAQDLLGLIEGTLEISRIESGLDEVRREVIGFPVFWEDLHQSCGRIPRRPGVTLDWFEAPPESLWSDPRRITIIVRNLVGNALKFTEVGSVRVTVDVVGLGLILRVQDSGIGIRREDQVRIFEMFRQADGSETRRFGGTGLGLHIVKRYTDQLGGTIVVESELGQGATFTVTLPDAVATATHRADSTALPAA